ncbi:hypothetical protein ACFLU8_05145 [Chloroflexota bacterium]
MPLGLRNFENVEELEGRLEKDDTDSTLYFVGKMDLSVYDCDNYALNLVEHARRDGYDIHFQLIKEYQRPDTGEWARDHAMCYAIIGSSIYLIEPSTDEF